MNPPEMKPAGGSERGPGTFAARLSQALLVGFLAFAVPILVFAVDYDYLGPIVRLGPFIAWTAAALGMAGYAAIGRLDPRDVLAGVCAAFIGCGALLAGGLFLAYLPIVFVARSGLFTVLEAGLVGTALIYGRAFRGALGSRAPEAEWKWGLFGGMVVVAALPILVQSLHDRHFDRRLADLSAPDAAVRSEALRSLVGSRFCWNTCTRAICDARGDLDADTVRAVLGSSDIALVCDEPDMSEWPG